MKQIINNCIAVLFLATACTVQEMNVPDCSSEQDEPVILSLALSDNGFFEPKNIDTLHTANVGKYAEYLAPSDYMVGLTSLKSNPLAQENIMAFTVPVSGAADTETKAGGCPMVYIDGIPIARNDTKATATADLAGLYGRRITVSVNSPDATKSDDGGSAELYVPALVHIQNPPVSAVEEEYPLCYYKDFVLEWNKDENNSNGVMVAVEWHGEMIFGDANDNAYIRRVDHFEDTGRAVLSESMFEGIPDTGLCNLIVFRGDLDDIVVDGSSYKMFGESHAILPFVLIREIKSVK